MNSTGNSFITLKDNSNDFLNHSTTRLLNPAKNVIGRINKDILWKVNTTLSKKLNANEWKNTGNVINWFKNISNKHLYKLSLFDIKDFYPSINDKLQWEAIRFAKCHIPITINDIEAIFHASKSLLSYKDEPWVKKLRKQLGRNNWSIRRDWGM